MTDQPDHTVRAGFGASGAESSPGSHPHAVPGSPPPAAWTLAGAPLEAPADEPRRPAISAIALVVANALPLFGVLFLGWEVFPIILLYWIENVIVGVLNVLRMLTCGSLANPGLWIGKIFMAGFFTVHYGLFTSIHGSFVFGLFGGKEFAKVFMPTPHVVQAAVHATGIGWAVVALTMSHAVSFIWNWILGGERMRVPLPQLMAQPYARVVVLHIAILLGGFAATALGQPAFALAVLIAVKTAIDLGAHFKERQKLGLSWEDARKRILVHRNDEPVTR